MNRRRFVLGVIGGLAAPSMASSAGPAVSGHYSSHQVTVTLPGMEKEEILSLLDEVARETAFALAVKSAVRTR